MEGKLVLVVLETGQRLVGRELDSGWGLSDVFEVIPVFGAAGGVSWDGVLLGTWSPAGSAQGLRCERFELAEDSEYAAAWRQWKTDVPRAGGPIIDLTGPTRSPHRRARES